MARKDRKEKEPGAVKKFLKKIGWWKIPLAVILFALFLFVFTNAVNFAMNIATRNYIHSFDPVDYSGVDRVVPELDPETGYYTFTTDRDLRIMVLTDLHIGGGFASIKTDRKAIEEIIEMLHEEKPDLVILDGDNTFAVPGPVYRGGGTLDNAMAARDVRYP